MVTPGSSPLLPVLLLVLLILLLLLLLLLLGALALRAEMAQTPPIATIGAGRAQASQNRGRGMDAESALLCQDGTSARTGDAAPE